MERGPQRNWDMHPGAWLISTILIVALVFLAATAYQTATAARIDSMAGEIAGNADPSIRHLSSARTELHAIDDAVTGGFLDHTTPDTLRHNVSLHEARMKSELDAYAAVPFFPTEDALWAQTREDIARDEDEVASVIDRLERGDVEGARSLRTTNLADAIRRADVGIENLILFDADQATRLGGQITARRRRSERTMWLLDALALSLAGVMLVIGKRAIDADTQMRTKLAHVASSAVSISESVPDDGEQTSVFRAAVDAACSVTNAAMCALGVGTDPKKRFDPFVARGFEDDEIEKIRVEGPPPGRPFMSVPLRHRGEVVGHLYLAKPPGTKPFTEQDARAAELLATITGTAAHNATLYESLRKAVIAREDLLSIVSHDLRNPLSAIIVGAALVKRTLPADAPAKGTVDIVTRNAARMDAMIRDLLTASKLREGKLAVEPKPTLVHDLLTETSDAFELAAADHGITLDASAAPGLPRVMCDAARIAQVLSNLVGNALKFTPKGGSITIDAERSGDEVVFSVRDTGVGIEPSAAAHVFDRFWQKTEDATRGTGLGLFIVKGIIESHAGRVWLESTPGEGSTFRFTLPIASP